MKLTALRYGLIFIILFSVVCIAGNSPEKIRLQLRWKHQFQFAGYYMAKELGFYEDAGIDLEILEGGTDTDVAHKVISGEAEYGVQTPSILVDRSKGYTVVVLAAIFQHSPVALIINSNSDIINPSDLAGKTIMLGEKNLEIRAMLKSEEILDKVKITPFTGNYKDILSGKIDGASGFITDVSYIENQAENTFSYIRPITYGIDFYGDCLFTTEKEMKKHQNRALAFRKASLKGWEYAMANPEKAIGVITDKYKSKSDRERLLFEYEQMKKLMYPDLVELGHMNPGRWKHIKDIFQNLGIISQDFEAEGFIYTDYLEPDNKYLKPFLLALTALLLIGFSILFFKYRNEKIKEALEEAKHKEELMKSEARFRGLIEFGADGILLGSHEGYITEANETACRLIGMNRDDLVGKYVAVIPFTKESIENTPLRFDLLKEGKTVVYERDLIKPDGTIANIEMKTKMMADGSYQSIFRDITEHKKAVKSLLQSEVLYKSLVETTDTGYVVINFEGKVLDANAKYVSLTGSINLSEILGRSVIEWTAEYEKGKNQNAILKCTSEGFIRNLEIDYIDKKGKITPVEINATTILRDEMLQIITLCRDITERRKAEGELKKYQQNLENMVKDRTLDLELSNKELESFAYSVSHDLRAPVRHVLGFTDILANIIKSGEYDKAEETLNKISSASARMEKLIDDLLALSRTGRQELVLRNVKMNAVVKAVADEYRSCKNNITAVIEIADLPAATADLNLLTIVWENLIDNACKYTKYSESPHISIGCIKEASEFVYFIKDNGVGFEMEYAHKLFGIFQRLHLEKDFPGTGIGLANVRRIISRHGGRTWAESEGEGKGAAFYFSLPIKKGD
jgi:PAS domain S-box-containing protein